MTAGSQRQEALLEVKAKIEEALNSREAQRSDPFANGLCEAIWIVEGMLGTDEQHTLEPPRVPPEGSGVKLIWPDWRPFHWPVPTLRDTPHRRPALPDRCYDASFGRVHVRPGCRC